MALAAMEAFEASRYTGNDVSVIAFNAEFVAPNCTIAKSDIRTSSAIKAAIPADMRFSSVSKVKKPESGKSATYKK